MGFFSKISKALKNAIGATVDVATGGLTTDTGKRMFGDVMQTAGLATPDALKRQQRAAEAAAKASADAAQLAADNLAKNALVDLSNNENSPDVIAGGTAQQLGLGGDLKRKRGSTLSTQLGVRV